MQKKTVEEGIKSSDDEDEAAVEEDVYSQDRVTVEEEKETKKAKAAQPVQEVSADNLDAQITSFK